MTKPKPTTIPPEEVPVVYATAPTGTVHLVAPPELDRTLCGKDGLELELGDETLSGVVATCQTCRKVLR